MEITSRFKKSLTLVLATTLLITGCLDETGQQGTSSAPKSDGSQTHIIIDGATSQTAGSCSPFLLKNKNSLDASVAVTTNTTVELSDNGTGSFYEDGLCTQIIGTATMVAGSSLKVVYYKNPTAPQNIVLMAGTAEMGYDTHFLTLTSGSSAVESYSLVMAGNESLPVSSCGVYTVTLKNSANLTVNALANLTIALEDNLTGTFYTSSACTTPLTSVVMTSGTSTKSFYYKNTTAPQTLVLNASTPGISAGTKFINITAAGSTGQMSLSLDGPTSLDAQTCGSFSLKTLNDLFQVTPITTAATVNLADNGSGSFYSNVSCTTPITSLSLSVGDSIRIFYYKTATAPQSMTFVATSPTLSGATKSLTITTNTNIATKVAITGPASATNGTCSAAFTVSTRNVTNTETVVTANTLINLLGAGSGSFYSDAACSSAITSVTIPSGYSSANFYLNTSSTGTLNLSADDVGPLTGGTHSLTVASNTTPVPTRLSLLGPANLNVATCSTVYQVRTLDSGGSLQGVTSNTTVNLTSSNGGLFYSDPTCTTPITSFSIGSGSSSGEFYYRSTSVGSTTITSTATGLTTTNQSITVSANSPTKLTLGGLASISTGVCAAYNVISRDSGNNISNVASSVLINLSGAGAGAFYSDSGCTSAITSATLNAGNNSQTIYFKSIVGGAVTLDAADAGATLTSATLGVTVNSAPVTKLTMTSVSSTPFNTCITVNLKSRDASNFEAPVSSSTTINLSGIGAGAFYSDAACTSAITTRTLAAGASSLTFYFKDPSAENLILTAAASGLTSGTQSLTVTPGVPSKLSLAGAASIAANACAFYTLATQDSGNNSSPVSSDTVVAVSATGAGQFYSDASCASPISSAVITAATSSKIIYYKNLTSQNVTFTSTASGLTNGTLSVSISTDPPTKIILAGSASALAGTCQAITLTTKNASDLNAPVGASTTVTLTGAGAGNFYSDSGCSTTATSIVLASGASSSTFYYKNNSTQSVNLNAAAAGLTSATHSMQTNPGAPATLSFSGLASLNVNDCASYTVHLKDTLNNDSPVSLNTALALTGAGTGSFFDSSSCTNAISTVIMTAGNSVATVFYKNTAPQNLTLNVDDSGPLTAGTLAVAVTTPAPTKLVMTGSSSMTAGSCIAVSITAKNESNIASPVASTTAITLGGIGAGSYYTSSTCTTGAVASASIPAGQSSVALYFKDTLAESLNLTATGGGLAAGALSVLVNAGNPSKLALSGAGTVNLGICSVFIISIKDSNDNDTASPITRIVNLTGNGAGAFYGDSSCASPVTSAQVPANQSAAAIYFKTASPASLTFSAASSGLTTGTLAVNAQPLVATKLALGGDTNVNVNGCATLTVESQDSNSYPSAVASNTTVTLTAGSGTYYSDAGCTSSITTVQISSGNSLATYHYKSTVAGTVALGATAAGLTSASKNLTVNPGTPTQLSLIGSASVYAGVCSLMTLETRDANNNAAPVTSSQSINLTGAGGGGYYSDASCSSSILNIVFATGEKTKFIYFKDNTQESVTLSASGTIGTSTLPVTVQAQSPTKLVLTGDTSFQAGLCRPYTISSKDALNNISSVASTTSIALAGGGSLGFFSDSGCTSSATTASIASSSSSTIVYLKETISRSLVLSATATGLTAGTYPVSITAAAPASLLLGGASTTDAGTCTLLTLDMKDSFNNNSAPTSAKNVLLSGAGAGAFYSDSSCLSSTSSALFTTADNTKIIYYKNNTASSQTLTAASSGLTSSNLSLTVLALPASKLIIAGDTNFLAGACRPYQITSKDTYNNVVNLGSNLTVTLGGGGSLGFFSDSGCTASVTTATITSGTNSALVYLKETVAASLLLSGTGSGMVSASFPVTVSAGAGTKLTLSGSGSISASICSVYSLDIRDAYDNLANVSSTQNITFSGLGSGSFYSNNNCSSNLPSAVYSAGENSKIIYFKDNLAESLTLSASGAGLTNGTLAVTVVPFTPTQLALVGTSPFNVQDCQLFTVYTRDAQANNSNLSSSKTITLSTDGDGAFFSDSGCSSSASSLSIASGAHSGTFYYKTSTAQTATVTVLTSGLSSATFSAVSKPLAPTKMTLAGSPALAAGTCGSYLLDFQDSLGNQSSAGAVKSVTLSGAGAGAFYSDSGCLLPISSISYTSSQFQKMIYFKAGTNGTYNLSAVDSGAPDLTDASLSVTVSGATGSNLPSLAFDDSGRSISESQGEIVLTAKLDSASASNITANYTVSGTATNPGRHNLASGSITIPAGSLSAEIRFLVYDDAISQPTQTIIVSLQTPAGAQLGSTSVYTFSLQDNDGGTGNLSLVQSTRSFSNLDNYATTGATSCIISAGALYCSGKNDYGQIGDTTTVAKMIPTPVTSMTSKVTHVVTNGNTTCAIKAGAVYCWGYNLQGQIGDSTTVNKSVPTAAIGLESEVTSIGISLSGTVCAIKSNALYCWGYNGTYTVGDGTGTHRSTPYLIPTLASGVTQVALHNRRTCAVQNGNLFCWGYNDTSGSYYGGLGDGTGSGAKTTPFQILTGGVTQVVIPDYAETGCALKSGAVYCWGYNGYGQVGDSTASSRYSPVATTVLTSGVTGIAGSSVAHPAYASFCAIKSGALYCWGYNPSGQLGIGSSSNASTPTALATLTSGVTDIAMSWHHSCAIRLGAVYCWGNNSYGQLADGTTVAKTSPTAVPTLTTQVTKLFMSQLQGGSPDQSVCAAQDGNIYCWGSNYYGQLFNGSISNVTTPYQVKPTLPFAATSLVSNTTNVGSINCAIESGALYCWGTGTTGSLGDGTNGNRSVPGLVPTMTSGVTKVATNSGGTVCAIKSGALFCWGLNTNGQAGDTTTTNRNTPFASPLNTGVTDVVVGESNTCAIANGALYCWGSNSYGNLGDGTTTARYTPTAVTNMGTGVTEVKIAGSSMTTCAIKSGGVYCWGYNYYGSLGSNVHGDGATANTPVALAPVNTGASKLVMAGNSSTYTTSCVIKSGAVYCWGYGGLYQIGNNAATTTYNVATANTTLTANVVDLVSRGTSNTTGFCALQSTGAMSCWGYGASGEIGNGSTANGMIPTTPTGMGSGVTEIYSTPHAAYVCAKKTGTLYCWGANSSSQMGDGTTTAKNTLYAVPGMTSVTDVNPSTTGICAINAGTVYCWGNNTNGTTGTASSVTSITSPTASVTFSSTPYKEILRTQAYRPAGQVQSGATHSCVVLNKKIFCWGKNDFGQLGDGTTTDSTSAVQVTGITDAVEIAVGSSHTCAIRENYALYCWGRNTEGQLGLGDNTYRSSPTRVGTKLYRMVRAGGTQTCADSGGLYCWGDNSYGQLGLANTTSYNTPQALNIDPYDFSVGVKTTCAIRSSFGRPDGTFCWGDNSAGQVGDGTNSNIRTSATTVITTAEFMQVAVGTDHTCGLKMDGTVMCWGYNANGQLGDNTTTSRKVATAVSTLTGIQDITSGTAHSCAMDAGGLAYCWGMNANGQLGIGGTISQKVPTQVGGISGLVSLGSGSQHGCYTRTTGDVACSGLNTSGQLGIGSLINRSIPDFVQGLTP